jgi:hypothetical protein
MSIHLQTCRQTSADLQFQDQHDVCLSNTSLTPFSLLKYFEHAIQTQLQCLRMCSYAGLHIKEPQFPHKSKVCTEIKLRPLIQHSFRLCPSPCHSYSYCLPSPSTIGRNKESHIFQKDYWHICFTFPYHLS